MPVSIPVKYLLYFHPTLQPCYYFQNWVWKIRAVVRAQGMGVVTEVFTRREE